MSKKQKTENKIQFQVVVYHPLLGSAKQAFYRREIDSLEHLPPALAAASYTITYELEKLLKEKDEQENKKSDSLLSEA